MDSGEEEFLFNDDDDEIAELRRDLDGLADLLWEAVDRGKARTVQSMLEQCCGVDVVNHISSYRSSLPDGDNPWMPLLTACAHGLVKIVRILLEAGANPQWQDPTGWSALSRQCLRHWL